MATIFLKYCSPTQLSLARRRGTGTARALTRDGFLSFTVNARISAVHHAEMLFPHPSSGVHRAVARFRNLKV